MVAGGKDKRDLQPGDIIFIDFSPQKGHEQVGLRPAIVISSNVFNRRTHFVMLCPITNTPPRSPLHVPLAGVAQFVTGTVLCDQAKSLDLNVRHFQYRETIGGETLERIRATVIAIIEDL